MPKPGPVSRSDLIANLRRLGFVGPISGAKHQFMIKGRLRVRIPNPHGAALSVGLLGKILSEAGIGRKQWEAL